MIGPHTGPGPTAQDIIDRHLEAIMKELVAAGIPASGIVAGVLHDGKTHTNWCVSDEVKDKDGKPVPVETIVREIASEIELATV